MCAAVAVALVPCQTLKPEPRRVTDYYAAGDGEEAEQKVSRSFSCAMLNDIGNDAASVAVAEFVKVGMDQQPISPVLQSTQAWQVHALW